MTLAVQRRSASRHIAWRNGALSVAWPAIRPLCPRWQRYGVGRQGVDCGGGAGAWIDLGDRDRHWWSFGWQVQRRVFGWLAIGVEIFHQNRRARGGASDTRFNVGAVVDLSETHHLLLSSGRSLDGPTLFQSYVASRSDQEGRQRATAVAGYSHARNRCQRHATRGPSRSKEVLVSLASLASDAANVVTGAPSTPAMTTSTRSRARVDGDDRMSTSSSRRL